MTEQSRQIMMLLLQTLHLVSNNTLTGHIYSSFQSAFQWGIHLTKESNGAFEKYPKHINFNINRVES